MVGPDACRNLPHLLSLAADGQRVSDTEFRSWEHYEDVPAVRQQFRRDQRNLRADGVELHG